MQADLLLAEISGSLKSGGKWPIKASCLILSAPLLLVDSLIYMLKV